MNGYEYDKARGFGKKLTLERIKIFTHPVIFDFFLNHYGYEIIRELSYIHDYLPKMARNRNDLLQIVFDYYSNLDSSNKLKDELDVYWTCIGLKNMDSVKKIRRHSSVW